MLSEIKTPFDNMNPGGFQSAADRRSAVERKVRDCSLTEVLLSSKPWRDIAVELLHGREVDSSGISREKHNSASGRIFHLRTVDGRPITGEGGLFPRGYIVGEKSLTSREQRELERRGGDMYIRRENATPDIHCDAVLATELLRAWGYRIREPRFWPRRVRDGERDASGKPVKQVDRWQLYEVGGPFDGEAQQRPDGRRKKAD